MLSETGLQKCPASREHVRERRYGLYSRCVVGTAGCDWKSADKSKSTLPLCSTFHDSAEGVIHTLEHA